MSHQQVFLTLMLLSCGYALALGGAPERLGAVIVLVASGATWLVNSPETVRYRTLEYDVLLVDAAMYGALLLLALRAQRFWPLWMSALQGLGVLGHGVGLLGSRHFNVTYAIVVQIWAYPIILMLPIATLRHRQRIARLGADASWTSFSRLARTKPVKAAPNA